MWEYLRDNALIIIPLIVLTISEINNIIKGRPDKALRDQQKKERLIEKWQYKRDKSQEKVIKSEEKLIELKKEDSKNENNSSL